METNKTIKLRKIKKMDQSYFLKWWKDKELIGLTSGVYEKSSKILKNYFIEMLSSKHDHHYVIILNGGEIIGNISLINKTKGGFEIHIVIGKKKYWGKSYGTLAIKKTLKIAFKKLEYKKVYLEVRPENKRAIRAYQKCGFLKDGFKKYPKNKNLPIVLRMVLLKKNF